MISGIIYQHHIMDYPIGRLAFFYLLYDKENPVYFYVGSTLDMNNRMNTHKTQPNCPYIKEVGLKRTGYELLEPAREVHSLEERLFIEQWYIDTLMPTLNSYKSHLTDEGRKEYMKAYNQTEKNKAYKKAYDQTEERKEYKKAYNQTEERKEYKKAYNQTEERKAYMKAYMIDYRIKRVVRQVIDDMLALLI